MIKEGSGHTSPVGDATRTTSLSEQIAEGGIEVYILKIYI
ncbi:hypothetical protein NIES2100_49530 [Calothrix sp. NIES-2100]|nr:hypothetical protein NIES2100_49530 [Calothrix sp. NIES-2100]